MTSQIYDILKEHIEPQLERPPNILTKRISMHDNSPSHLANKINECLNKTGFKESFNEMACMFT